jgi:hypothetical protein
MDKGAEGLIGATGEIASRPRRRWFRLVGVGVLLALALYYPVGAWRAHVIDDDVTFVPRLPAPGASKAVALAGALIRREIDGHGWSPNKPFFMPVVILDDMPSFQKGVIAAIGRFAIELDQTVGRPGAGDADLTQAATFLQYPANIWMINPAAPWENTISTEKQYRNAARGFEGFNQRLLVGNAEAVLTGQPEILRAVLLGFVDQLEDTAADLEEGIERPGGWLNRQASRRYYSAKGRAYAILMLTRALRDDYAGLIAERKLAQPWQAMEESLTRAATARPWLVLAGPATSTLLPDHLAEEGFFVLRGGRRMASLAEALR